MQMNLNIPEWGKKTCVVGSHKKEGEYNGKKYSFTEVFGVSVRTYPTENGFEDVIVSEAFKVRGPVAVEPGKTYQLVFDRYGGVVDLLPVGKEV